MNSEGVYDTRPWKIFGEGPVAETSIPLHAQGFNEGNHAPYTAADIRFVVKGDILYAHVLAHPEDNKVVIKSLSEGNSLMEREISSVSLVGSNSEIKFNRSAQGLIIELPEDETPNGISLLLKIS